jgi:hypothetical protein
MQNLISTPKAVQLHRELSNQLMTGERLIWYGQPSGKRMRSLLGAWLFAIPWTLFALYFIFSWYQGAQASSKFSFLELLPLAIPMLFVAIGIFMLIAPIIAISSAKHTIHALTNLRVITFSKAKRASLKSVDFDDMGPISFDENSDGWGNLTIETGSHINSKGNRVTETFDIIGVPEVAKLERLLREAQQAR